MVIKQSFMALAVATALSASGAVYAVDGQELRELREQVQQLKQDYERRLQALEARLQQAERRAQSAESKAESAAGAVAQAQPGAAASRSTGAAVSESAFNPAVSVVLNGVYSNLSRDPAGFRIGGFVPSGGDVGPGSRGFSLGESELVLAANIDQNFRGTLIATLQPDDSLGVEEAYLQTLGLGRGLTLKAGRYYSALGYLNEQHAHTWDFADAPLANKVFLGGQLADDGLQLKWLAPTDTYFELGAAAGRGRSFPASNRDKNGVGAANLYARLGGDWGESLAWRLGLSHLRTAASGRSYADANALGTQIENSFDGSSRLWVVDGVLKWAPQGNATVTNFKLQGEYFRRNEDGNLNYDTAAVSAAGTQSGSLRAAQSGWYAQGVYQFMPRWRLGYRYDRLHAGKVNLGLVDSGRLSAADFPSLAAYTPVRNTLMLDFSASEFSRLRLQFAKDQSRPGASDHQVLLQYIMSLGAHAAHAF